jgi:hypothetical protein
MEAAPMTEYEFAVWFWSTLIAFGLAAPLVLVLVREAKTTLQHLRDSHAPPSLTSAPVPSRPSGC